MSFKKKTIVSTVILGLAMPTIFAATSDADLQAQLKDVMEQTATLQKQVDSLQSQLKETKAKANKTAAQQKNVKSKSGAASTTQANNNAILTRPLFQIGSAFDGSDVLSNVTSTMNTDLTFLKANQAMENAGNSLNADQRPLVTLGGKIEAGAQWNKDDNGQSGTQVNLNTVGLEILGQVSPWAFGFADLSYDSSNNPTNTNPLNNSRIYVNKAFVTLGNLNKLPVYFSAGQMNVPFGQYASDFWVADPLTKTLFRTETRTAVLGYSAHGLNLSTYIFNGVAGNDKNPGEYGANAGYDFSVGPAKTHVGVGAIKDISNSLLLQDGGLSGSFAGFSNNLPGQSYSPNNLIDRTIPAGDANASVTIGNVDVFAEYVDSFRDFDPTILSFNNQGARMKALQTEVGYRFKIMDKPANFEVAFNESWQALAVGAPKDTYRAGFSVSWWKNTVESLEYYHDVNYAESDVGGAVGSSGPITRANTFGHQQNTVLAQIGVYF